MRNSIADNSEKLTSIFFLFFFFLFIIEGVFIFSSYEMGKEYSDLLIFQLCLIYFTVLFKSYKQFGINSIFTLFLLCLGLFNFQKFFWDWLLDEDFRKAESLISIDLPELVVQKMLYFYSVFVLFLYTSYGFFYMRFLKQGKVILSLTSDKRLFRVGLTVFLICMPLSIIKSYMEFTSLFGKSYTEYYTEESISIPFYLRLAALFFQVSYMIVLASIPTRKNFIIISFIFLAVLVPYLFIGLRANFAVTLLFIFWYYTNVYDVKVKLVKLIIPLVLLLSLLQIVAINRNIYNTSQINIVQLIPTFLYEQSQSMYVFSLYIQYFDEVKTNGIPFLLDPLYNFLYPSGQSIEVVTNRSSLGHSLTYSLSPIYYLSGSSLGTNFIAELYEFGLISILIGAVVFSYFIIFFQKKVFQKRIYLFLSLVFIQYFLLAPRSSFLPNVYFIFKVLLIYFIILILFRLYNKKYLS